MARKNSGAGMFGALTLRQTERLIDRLREGAEALPWGDLSTNATASEIYDVLNQDLHPTWQQKWREGKR